MKVRLIDAGYDFGVDAPGLANAPELVPDLELDTLLERMASGDRLIWDVASAVLARPLMDLEAIRFRQAVLADCLAHADAVRALYALALDAVAGERRHWSIWTKTPEAILTGARSVMSFQLTKLRELRVIADREISAFASDGFDRLFTMLHAELTDDYFGQVEAQLELLEFKHGVLISAGLGRGNKGSDYVLRLSPVAGWRDWLGQLRRPPHAFDIHPRDEASQRALGELKDRGLNLAANALAQSADHVKSFWTALMTELAFYVGCLNLHEHLSAIGAPDCLPEPTVGPPELCAAGLYDPALALKLGHPAVGNDLSATGSRLIVITGANQGGKSTLLRAIGLAQLMLQAGMFVAAESFRADLRDQLFTHFKREEDEQMESGKLDEELRRMRQIAEALTSQSMVLFNESFQSTNEREGSELARQVAHALTEGGVKVAFVTHLFDFADGLHSEGHDDATFLRAERGGGERSYRVVAGPPLPTSYGADTYAQVWRA